MRVCTKRKKDNGSGLKSDSRLAKRGCHEPVYIRDTSRARNEQFIFEYPTRRSMWYHVRGTLSRKRRRVPWMCVFALASFQRGKRPCVWLIVSDKSLAITSCSAC